MISMNTHLKGVLVFKGVFDIDLLFIVDILHYVNNGSVYTLSLMSFQILAVAQSSSDLVDLCHNL